METNVRLPFYMVLELGAWLDSDDNSDGNYDEMIMLIMLIVLLVVVIMMMMLMEIDYEAVPGVPKSGMLDFRYFDIRKYSIF